VKDFYTNLSLGHVSSTGTTRPLVQVTPTALAHGTRQPVICADVVCMLDAALDDSACMLSPYKVRP